MITIDEFSKRGWTSVDAADTSTPRRYRKYRSCWTSYAPFYTGVLEKTEWTRLLNWSTISAHSCLLVQNHRTHTISLRLKSRFWQKANLTSVLYVLIWITMIPTGSTTNFWTSAANQWLITIMRTICSHTSTLRILLLLDRAPTVFLTIMLTNLLYMLVTPMHAHEQTVDKYVSLDWQFASSWLD